MIFIHSDPSTGNVELINQYIEEGKTVFMIIYKEGCGPCKKTRPEWGLIQGAFGEYSNPDIVVADVDVKLMPALKYVGQVRGVPTMRVISEKGNLVEDSQQFVSQFPQRTLGFFVEWIMSKIKK